MLLLAVAVWWTFAVVALVIMLQDAGRDIFDRGLIVALAMFWPICGIALLPVLLYQGLVASTKRIRSDLHNRGVLAEFEDWLKQKEQGKILPK